MCAILHYVVGILQDGFYDSLVVNLVCCLLTLAYRFKVIPFAVPGFACNTLASPHAAQVYKRRIFATAGLRSRAVSGRLAPINGRR